MRRSFEILIVLAGVALILGAFTLLRSRETELPQLELEKRILTTKVVGLEIAYEEVDLWVNYDKVIQDREAFSETLISNFTNIFSGYNIQVEDPTVIFEDENRSTTFRCVIHGAITKTGDRYCARFEWLLRPLGLDFIDDHFEESEYGLSWEGYAKGVWTEITCEFPYTGMVYEAWGEPVGHCHAHVWWKT